jgi:ribosome biogenesis GTPase / thiamine phosphate phosphatase
MTTLINYGWNNFHPQNISNTGTRALLIGRVISIKGFKYDLITEKGPLETELSGKLLFGTFSESLPKVGDWVLFMDYETMGYIIEVLPRMNALSRKSPGAKTEKQVLAANVDFAMIVQGLDRDFNIMRLERYIVQITACGITPIVILNKADLIEDQENHRKEIAQLMRECPVYFCSTYTGLGIDELNNNVLQKGKTYIFIGSSGVGKSSLLNSLMHKELQKTNSTSDVTSKGKHTTTTRDLFALPNGSLVIDTPGMREFGLTFEDDQHSDKLFPAIQKFASACKFTDCRHLQEAGCAVMEAVNSGALDEGVYESYLKLLKEQRRFEIKIEDKKRLGKQFGKMTKEAKAYRKKYKY